MSIGVFQYAPPSVGSNRATRPSRHITMCSAVAPPIAPLQNPGDTGRRAPLVDRGSRSVEIPGIRRQLYRPIMVVVIVPDPHHGLELQHLTRIRELVAGGAVRVILRPPHDLSPVVHARCEAAVTAKGRERRHCPIAPDEALADMKTAKKQLHASPFGCIFAVSAMPTIAPWSLRPTISLYESLGFEVRAEVNVTVLERADSR